jgi:hypothetical protein
VVVVARDDDDLGPGPPHPQQRVDHELLRARRRCRQVVDVAGHQDRVDLAGLRERGDLGEDGALLL